MSARRRTALVILAAVLGIAVAAAITWGTSQLVRQRIGLASEPLTVGRRLLAPAAHTPVRGPSSPRQTTTTSTPTPTPSRAPTTSSTPIPTPGTPPAAAPEPAPESPLSKAAPAESSPFGGSSARDGGGDSSSRRDD